jgi:molecular chaperone DnaK
MMKDAESHAEEDRKRKEEIEVRNRADQALYAGEKMVQDMGAKLTPDDKTAVEGAVNTLRNAISANDVAGMTTAMEQLTVAQHKAAEAMYKTAGAGGAGESAGEPHSAPGGQAGGGAPAGDGDVIDAEVVDEEKK